MATNLAVKALLGWVNSLKLCDAEITVDELQDGVILLKLVYMIKKEPNSCLNDSPEDRLSAVAEFIGECRFSNTKGTSLCWENIRAGINSTVEIAKVLLLLIHQDMMNDRLTLNMLDCDVERELAHLCGSFVLESEGQVYLATGLDAYLRRRHLPVSQEIFARSATTSTSNTSTVSSLSDDSDESPVFHRAKTIKFVEMETVASTSVSSPLGDVMNTPKFQLKKMQREIIKERDYRDCLEKELASKIALIAQRESQMNQLKYRLDKLQEEQDDQEHIARAQINELQIQNNNLQRRLDEMLMQNKDLKNNASLMEHKVDELTEENGLLSTQVRAACSRFAIFETEVGRLTEDHASAQEEWRKETSRLQSELDQATAQKELLTEQIEILQGKISSLEDEIRRASLREDVGENMGPIMEMDQLKTEVFTYCKHIAVLEEEVSRLRLEIQTKEAEAEKIQTQLIKQEQEKLLKTQQESAQQINLLQQQLASAKADLKQHKETQAANLRLKKSMQELQVTILKEKEVLVQEKEVLLARILQAEKDQEALQERVEALVSEKERLIQANQAAERENVALRKLESVLQQELEILKMENKKLLKAKGEEIELTKRDLQEQLAAKSKAAQHYKAQMEKAVSHYNSKKLLLQKRQEEVDALKCSLEVKEQEMQAIITEKRLLQLDLEKAQSSEKMLSNRVASLEAQLALDDQTSKVQNKTQGSATGWCFFEVPNTNSSGCSRAQEKRAMSSDSLDQSSLDDSLNLKRACTEDKMEADSTQNNPTSAKRCRTTQKSSGCREDDEPFYSLPSAHSQLNPSSANSTRPVCLELFDIPAESCASDQLIGLPGYRHSVVYAQPTSTFYVGAENEPDGAPEDWLRIAELQTRNKACLPHLKSSYPLETETGRNGPFIFTDEELRTGDPSDTIRRVSKMPGQVQGSHQHSLTLGQTGGTVSTRFHHLSLLPGQLPSKTINSHQSRSLKGPKQSSSMLSVQQTSLEKTTNYSCLPRPLTPKNNLSSGPSSSILYPVLGPAEWRQSVMFMVENSPKSSNGLKKRLSKLRGSARKSPRSSLKKSPAQMSTRRSEDKMPSGSSHGVGQAGKVGSYKSPQVATKELKKSPQTTSRSVTFPGLTGSAHKVNMHR
ncbi:nuclear mitotic apparatus protein 1 isoform X2 [Archocentrus centrarchus]|uniref:nuclear mitotic apparatus protein 1 isoform X2 n=1 Tax=Archocentrus centrarchus TaxID=63155 RepID=UPI0011E9D42A|nr:nuclear mitotic apparatus protein 1 isoform X2 [Archocentrus centrarchus]